METVFYFLTGMFLVKQLKFIKPSKWKNIYLIYKPALWKYIHYVSLDIYIM